MTKDIDALLDGTIKDGGACRALVHRVPEVVRPILIRARERMTGGEYISASKLCRAMEREFKVDELDERRVSYYLLHGCSCHG